ncbi:MAG: hypothetical protein CMM01_11925 [Rhodopirellula sp.]|nr:hypothetical protein [Rhodopirellula sp.]OUX51110.1 MAG: hypothetical protein CBE43_04735 [Rhodopirellula sp. TMED283]
MWPFLHSILLRYIHGFAAGVEVAFWTFDRLSEKSVSEMRRHSGGNDDPRAYNSFGSMALFGHRSSLAKSGVRDFFSKETFLVLLRIPDSCERQALSVGSCRQERLGTTAPDWWFLSPLIRGQLNDSRTNAADPDLLDDRGRDYVRFFQAH